MHELGTKVNLVICQKSKIDDWINHFKIYYSQYKVHDLTDTHKDAKRALEYGFWTNYRHNTVVPSILVINYELAFRRKELLKLENFTLMLDESSLIQNEQAKRSKFILKLKADNVILLSGTPTGGKYENLWSQIQLLGWNISKKMFYNHYVNYHYDDNNGFPLMVIDGYKNEERLKRKMREHGCHFLKTDEVFDLPEQIHQTISINTTKEYRKFRKDSIVHFNDIELVGDTTLTKMLYERQLCGMYNGDKLEAFRDLVESTNDRLIVFYNFNEELKQLQNIAVEYDRNNSIINGTFKSLYNYEHYDNSITFIQYQAGAMGLNLQKANKIVYFTPPLSSELFEQSKKRTHRIGQERTCFYYYLTCKNSVEEKIYKTLEMRKDYTDALFEAEC
jgi:SNF2 family DNA or RNA helicase